MNIDEALTQIVQGHNLTRFDIGIITREDGTFYCAGTAWGEGIGLHGCCTGYGETVAESISNTLSTAAQKRALQYDDLEIAA